MGSILKKLLILPPIVAAVLIVYAMNTRPQAEAQETSEQAVAVRVMTVAPRAISVEASGFGRVVAAQTWSGVAEVQGRLTQYADTLQVGALVREGDVLFEIDARDYEIAVSQAEADVLRAEADLAQLLVNAENTASSLAVEKEILEIYQADRDRVESLVDRGSIAASELEAANRTLLSQNSVVASLETSLTLVEPDTLSSEASLAKAEADLESAQRDLARTRVTAPFDGRVVVRGASAQQYVRAGDVLIEIEGLRSAEVEAAFQPTALAQLLGTVDVAQLTGLGQAASFGDIFGDALRAEVRGQFGNGFAVTWPAELLRITGNIDESTGSLGVVVQVENAGRGDRDTGRPPLVSGSFVEVLLTGPEVSDAILVAEHGLHYEGDATYVLALDDDNRLARFDVTTGPPIDGLIVIEDGIEAGTRVILSDPRPATVGLLLEPIESDISQ